jgi:hypothetical protein
MSPATRDSSGEHNPLNSGVTNPRSGPRIRYNHDIQMVFEMNALDLSSARSGIRVGCSMGCEESNRLVVDLMTLECRRRLGRFVLRNIQLMNWRRDKWKSKSLGGRNRDHRWLSSHSNSDSNKTPTIRPNVIRVSIPVSIGRLGNSISPNVLALLIPPHASGGCLGETSEEWQQSCPTPGNPCKTNPPLSAVSADSLRRQLMISVKGAVN